jgi:hypothetical protein
MSARDPLDGELESLDGGGRDGLEALPGLARIAATAWWHTGTWALNTSLRASRRVAEAVLAPEKAPDLVRDAGLTARRALLTVAAVTELDKRLPDLGPRPQAPGRNTNGNSRPPAGALTLRAEGEELMRRSRDVRYEEDAHPAYERILSELAPDEGRVLRLLMVGGPQPSVDVRTGGPLGLVKSQLIAPGLNMIGARAGCRYVDRVPSYLNNLFRLGLIWFSHETIRDHLRYQVLEAQPDVLEAIHSVRHAKVVRRSIHLTPFGEDFCRVCLTDSTTPLLLPEHSAPKSADTAPQPPAEAL